MPGCVVAFLPASLAGVLESGLLLMLRSPGADAPHTTAGTPSGSRPGRGRPLSGSVAFPAMAPPARRTEKAAAPPASRDGLQRIAGQLIDKEKFDHGEVSCPARKWGGIPLRGMPPAGHQPCSFCAVSAITRP